MVGDRSRACGFSSRVLESHGHESLELSIVQFVPGNDRDTASKTKSLFFESRVAPGSASRHPAADAYDFRKSSKNSSESVFPSKGSRDSSQRAQSAAFARRARCPESPRRERERERDLGSSTRERRRRRRRTRERERERDCEGSLSLSLPRRGFVASRRGEPFGSLDLRPNDFRDLQSFVISS